jgi:hypothetical protein
MLTAVRTADSTTRQQNLLFISVFLSLFILIFFSYPLFILHFYLFLRFTFFSFSDHSYWLQIQGSGFDSRHYQIFWEVVGLERGPLSLVSTVGELLGRKRNGSGLENRDHGCRGSAALTTRYSSLADPGYGVRPPPPHFSQPVHMD